MPEGKLTDKEKEARVKLFTDRVYFWQKKLCFQEVEIHVMEQNKPSARGSFYSIVDGMIITICYSCSWIQEVGLGDEEIDKVAFHEVFESQFHEIEQRLHAYYSEDYTSQMLHSIVRKAENSIFPSLRKDEQ